VDLTIYEEWLGGFLQSDLEVGNYLSDLVASLHGLRKPLDERTRQNPTSVSDGELGLGTPLFSPFVQPEHSGAVRGFGGWLC
jgi:hypothetical protein